MCLQVNSRLLYIHKFASNRNLRDCYFCKGFETVPHLFLECKFFIPLNKCVLYLLNTISEPYTVALSEKLFRFFDFKSFSNSTRYVELVLLSISRFVIWYIRNQVKYSKKNFTSVDPIRMFLSLLKFRLNVDFTRFTLDKFIDTWVQYDFVTVLNSKLKFCEELSSEFYIRKFRLDN